jgi:hypothetical protein
MGREAGRGVMAVVLHLAVAVTVAAVGEGDQRQSQG